MSERYLQTQQNPKRGRSALSALVSGVFIALLPLSCHILQASEDVSGQFSLEVSPKVLNSSTFDFSHMVSELPGTGANFPISAFAVLSHFEKTRMAELVARFCEEVDAKYRVLGWRRSPCLDLPWTFSRVSEHGRPLIYWEYINSDGFADPNQMGTTLVLGGVHADELTPVHIAFRFANALKLFPENYRGQRVVIAPLVNPDGFFLRKPTRTNANGVDLNRNFPTSDWWAKAGSHWTKKRNKDPRHFPGVAPGIEEGTRFQMDLMSAYVPDKVISIHAPLGWLDYDGPGDTRTTSAPNEKKARELVFSISRSSNNYKVAEFPIYPGSLGNYSGFERSVPTVTLELDSTNPNKVNQFWREFYPGLKAAIKFDFRRTFIARLDPECHSVFCTLAQPIIRQQDEEQ